MAEVKVKVSCHCQKNQSVIALDLSDLPLSANICHCDTSRHVSGVLGTISIKVPSGPASLDNLTAFETSEFMTRYSCSTCGAQVFAYDTRESTWRVPTGLLDRTEGIFEIQAHMWVGDTRDGGMSDWIPSISGRPLSRWLEAPEIEKSKELFESQTLGGKVPTMKFEDEDKIHAHCRCGGVQFYITLPDKASAEATSPWPDLIVPYHSGSPENPENETWWLAANKTKYLAGTCACDSCRLTSGYEITPWAFIPKTNLVQLNGQPLEFSMGTLKQYESSPGVYREFCSRCGATVFYHNDERPALVDVAVGLLHSTSGVRAENLLEWRTERVSFEEDAINRSLVDGLREGLGSWGVQRQGRTGPRAEPWKSRKL
ncbi:DUF636 domain protein [Xylona heveae TC161]|uniref:DUF636 domain protein n=1 Tax=Xylona heveae (strain CBS 132557 / TC161) TaxID=1328760 RepID=A0A165H1Z6_XYLHT|nr:DUF636 domain protein [Xylona heveae TC161]KZF22881.1 DUF636 domain protein [Xylona heveae TC161]